MPSSGIRLGGAIPSVPALQITTTNPLPGAVANVPYSDTLSAVGGIPGYNWTLISFTAFTASATPSSLTTTSYALPITTPTTTASGTGGLAPYSYAWSWASGGTGITINSPTAGATTFSAASLTVGNNVSGTAQCIVTDSFLRAITVTVPVSITRESQLTAAASPSTLSTTGLGSSVTTGSTTVTPSGGTSPYTYAWTWQSGGTSITINSASSASTTFTGSGLSPGGSLSGTALCTVTDTYGQTATCTVSVSTARDSNMSLVATPSIITDYGPGASLTTVTTTVTPTGGTSPYTYAWSWQTGGTGITINSATSATTAFSASGLAVAVPVSGVAVCSVTDAIGQNNTVIVDVTIQRTATFSANLVTGVNPPDYGYDSTVPYGSLSSTTDNGGNTVIQLYYSTSPIVEVVLTISGFSSDPGQNYFNTLIANSVNFTSASASSHYSAGSRQWVWTTGSLPESGTYAVSYS